MITRVSGWELTVMHLPHKLSRHHSRSIMYKIMTGQSRITGIIGIRVSQVQQVWIIQWQPRLFTTRLFQALPYQELLRLLISLRLETTLLTAVSLTFRAVSTRAGISILTAGNLAALSSSMRLALEIPTVAVPQEPALLRMSPRMAAIGHPGLTPLPAVVTCISIPATWARRVVTTVLSATSCVRPQKINNTFAIKQMIMFVYLTKSVGQEKIA